MTALHAGFQLRSMGEDDLPAVVAIEDATQPTPWTEQVFRDCFNSHYDCRVIARDGDIAGFAVLSSVLDEVHLLNIAVAPAMQRRGLAWAALRELIADYQQRSMGYIYLEVRASNQGARQLYQRLGFQLNGERKNYYRTTDGRENAILMSLALQQ
ncbi:MAG: ribosomal protein S18-alanine N-acetyltransferase [Alcanivoracaceae bacterium]|nr:ribosomal protein S18-alanine N-acetyltransferase [Alcanivoracaceae bacterium]